MSGSDYQKTPDWRAAVRAMRAAPKDVGKRAFFADLIEECGDPTRDMFVRHQTGYLTQDTPHYPGTVFSYSEHRSIDKRLGWLDVVSRLMLRMDPETEPMKGRWGGYSWDEDELDHSVIMKVGQVGVIVRNGYVDGLDAPLESLWGNVCDKCSVGRESECEACNGHGWVEGITPAFGELIRREPVLRVVVTGLHPGNNAEPSEWSWFTPDPLQGQSNQRRGWSVLPRRLFKLLPGREQSMAGTVVRRKTYPTQIDAMIALEETLLRTADETEWPT